MLRSDATVIPPPVQGRVVIDVSNVCYSRELPPRTKGKARPVLDRLTQVVDAWRHLHGADASIACVADASVRSQIGRPWHAVARLLDIEVTSYADELILDLARDEHRFVLTGDQFVDHRKTYPWIDSQPERFLHWRFRNGSVAFLVSGIRRRPHEVVSQRSEVKRLRQVGLDPKEDRELLETRWRCETRSCLRAQVWQDVLLSWPAKDDNDKAICPVCRAPLTSLGPRGHFREVVVFPMDADDELTRFPLEHDVPLVVGRGRRDQGISLDGLPNAPERISRISRQHVLLDLDERGGLRVSDLGSSNGTVIRQRSGAPATAVTGDEPTPVPPGGRVELAGVVRLELSGKRFLSFLEPGPRSSDDGGTERATVHRPAGH